MLVQVVVTMVCVIGHAKDMCNFMWNVTLSNMKTKLK